MQNGASRKKRIEKRILSQDTRYRSFRGVESEGQKGEETAEKAEGKSPQEPPLGGQYPV